MWRPRQHPAAMYPLVERKTKDHKQRGRVLRSEQRAGAPFVPLLALPHLTRLTLNTLILARIFTMSFVYH
ncbi:hypothetical protein E2C01_038269 [Portunus trituberculatus]|uniref:Uncharacterized protein n=1 Tax=Portunus trituberculatus TaxID=210409 RepID=A0A5B7FDQ7_PORTR|nr:hypothetical protein [Portunus trituberculatus]